MLGTQGEQNVTLAFSKYCWEIEMNDQDKLLCLIWPGNEPLSGA